MDFLEEVVLVLSGSSWWVKSQNWNMEEMAWIEIDLVECFLSAFGPLDGYLLLFQGSSTERKSQLDLTQLHSKAEE